MPKLHQIIALVTGKKTRTSKLLTDSHHGWKQELINGITRTYEPLDAEGEKLPSETKKVQVRVQDVVSKISEELVQFFDIVATQEYGNTTAKADVVVDGQVIVKDIPVSVLLFLDKQLIDLHTFITNLPILPNDRDWTYSEEANCYVSSVQQMRTQKTPTNFVKFTPTQHQPGQSEIIYIDKAVGTWNTKHFSGAISQKKQSEVLARVVKLQEAVKSAREEANSQSVEEKKIGSEIMKYVFGDSLT